jgi:lysophospholipase L1-like esterase
MKRIAPYFVLAILLCTAVAFSFQKKTRVIFFGDSITQMGINPGGYITLLQDSLNKKGLSSQYELIGSGVGYNKVYDLYLRMDSDVMVRNPDKVFIWIGVNDVGHKRGMGTGTDADKFERFYEAIIKKMQAKNIQLVLCTPASIGERTDYTNTDDGELNYYSDIIRNLAKKFNCGLIDFRKDFHEYALSHNPDNKSKGILTTDGIHLNEGGNRFVAARFFETLTKKQ